MPDSPPPCEVVRDEVDGLSIESCETGIAGLDFEVFVTVENTGSRSVDTYYDVALAVRAVDANGNEVPIEQNLLQISGYGDATSRAVEPGDTITLEYTRTVTDDASPKDVDRFEVTLDPCEGSECY